MVASPVVAEPFATIAFDLVGPLSKGRGGFQLVLTFICLASRWPDAIPLRIMTANNVAKGMIDIFLQNRDPLSDTY